MYLYIRVPGENDTEYALDPDNVYHIYKSRSSVGVRDKTNIWIRANAAYMSNKAYMTLTFNGGWILKNLGDSGVPVFRGTINKVAVDSSLMLEYGDRIIDIPAQKTGLWFNMQPRRHREIANLDLEYTLYKLGVEPVHGRRIPIMRRIDTYIHTGDINVKPARFVKMYKLDNNIAENLILKFSREKGFFGYFKMEVMSDHIIVADYEKGFVDEQDNSAKLTDISNIDAKYIVKRGETTAVSAGTNIRIVGSAGSLWVTGVTHDLDYQ